MNSPGAGGSIHPMAPLIRFTLLGLYLALVLPLPLLAPAELRWPMAVALPLGLLVVLAITSEQVEVDDQGLRVGHPAWCAWLLRRGWQLSWQQVTGLTSVTTSQGGRVHYVRSEGRGSGSGRSGSGSANAAGSQAWLLPQRVADFDLFLSTFQAHTGIDTSGVGRITPAWTYQLLAGLSGLMLAGETLALLRWGFS
jgi:hypothetical protein